MSAVQNVDTQHPEDTPRPKLTTTTHRKHVLFNEVFQSGSDVLAFMLPRYDGRGEADSLASEGHDIRGECRRHHLRDGSRGNGGWLYKE